MNEDKLHLNATIFLIGFLICIASSIGVNIQWIPIEYKFGLLQMLPFSFWIGFFLCVSSTLLSMREDSRKIFLGKVFLLYLLIWSIPVLFEKNPAVWGSYTHYLRALLYAHISDTPFMGNYRGWPGFFLLGSMASVIIGKFNPLPFLKYYPLFSSAIGLLAIYLFFKSIIKEKMLLRYALLISIFLNVWTIYHFSPQSLGMPVGLLLLTSFFKEGTGWSIASVIFFSFLTISHPTTVVILLPILILSVVSSYAYNSKKKVGFASFKKVLLFTCIWLAWLFISGMRSQRTSSFLHETFTYISSRAILLIFSLIIIFLLFLAWEKFFHRKVKLNVPQLTERYKFAIFVLLTLVFAIMLAYANEFIAAFASYLEYTFPKATVIHVTSLFIYFALSCAFMILAYVRKNNLWLLAYFVPWFIVFGFLGFLTVVVLHGLFMDRIFLYFSFASSILVVKLLSIIKPSKRALIWLVLIAVTGIHFSTIYHDESRSVIGDQSLAASQFIYSGEIREKKVIGGRIVEDIWKVKPETYKRHIPFKSLPLSKVYERGWNIKKSFIVVIDDYDELWYETLFAKYRDAYEYYKGTARDQNLIYDNGRYRMYRRSN